MRNCKAEIDWSDDKEPIKTLSEETARCFDYEKVRMMYVAAQVVRIDLKVDLAVLKTMLIYKKSPQKR